MNKCTLFALLAIITTPNSMLASDGVNPCKKQRVSQDSNILRVDDFVSAMEFVLTLDEQDTHNELDKQLAKKIQEYTAAMNETQDYSKRMAITYEVGLLIQENPSLKYGENRAIAAQTIHALSTTEKREAQAIARLKALAGTD